MFVCICNAYRSTQIIEAARCGYDDAEEVYHALGGGPICRQCLVEAQSLVDRHYVNDSLDG